MKCHFQKKNIIRDISWSCSLFKCWYLYQKNMIVLYGNGRTSALKWRKVTYASDKNERFYRPKHINFSYKQCVLVCKIFHYHPMHMLLTQFWHFHKVQSRFSGTLGDTGIWIKTASACVLYDGFSGKWHFIFRLLYWHVEMIFIQMLLEIIKCHTNTKKMRYCSLISNECKCLNNSFFWWPFWSLKSNKGERKIFGSFFVICVQYFTRIRIRFWFLGRIRIRKKNNGSETLGLTIASVTNFRWGILE